MKCRIATLCSAVLILAGCGALEKFTTLEKVLEENVVDASGKELSASYVLNTDYLLLYFSASWCPPCQAFTPKLVEFYNKEHGGSLFQVLLVSNDHSERDMRAYMQKARMPWPATVYHSKAPEILRNEYGGPGIPCLVLLDRKGKILAHSYKGKKYLGPNHVLQELQKKLNERKLDPAGISEVTGQKLPTPDKLAKKYKVDGFGQSGDQKMAMMNGQFYKKGDEIDKGVNIREITDTYVEIEYEANFYRLKPE